MITAFILLPVFGVLAWLYWYLLPANRKWGFFDTALMALVVSVDSLNPGDRVECEIEGVGSQDFVMGPGQAK